MRSCSLCDTFTLSTARRSLLVARPCCYEWISYRKETALQGGLVLAGNGKLGPGDDIF